MKKLRHHLQGQHHERRTGCERGGAAWAGGFRGGPRKPPREWTLVHWYPPGGGGGPKKRHLVLYKLAGFCTADRGGCGAFFRLHSSPLVFDFLSKMCKMCTFWHIFGPKNPIFPLFWPLFCTFLRETPRGRGDPFVGGPPGGRAAAAAGGAPPWAGGPGGRVGGVTKIY